MEKSIQINPRLRRANVMLNSFSSGISNTSEEFSRTPEMSCSKIIPQPGMLLHQLESRITLKQLECFTNTHCWRQFNKQVDVVNCNMKLVNFTSMFQGNLSNKSLAVNFDSEKLEWVPGIFTFPDKMESILSEGVFKTLQIHFFSPKLTQENTAHANFIGLVHEGINNPRDNQAFQELNIGGRIPPMLESMGILRQM